MYSSYVIVNKGEIERSGKSLQKGRCDHLAAL